MQRTSGMLALIVSMVCGTMAYGLQGPVRTGKAVIPHVDENLGSVNIDYEYSVRNECVFIKVRQVVVGLSGSMDGELENELRKRNILPHTQQSGSGIRFTFEGTVDFGLNLRGSTLPISGSYSGSSDYVCFSPTDAMKTYATEYAKKNKRNFYVFEARVPLPIRIGEFTFSGLSAKVDEVRRELSEKKHQQKQKELTRQLQEQQRREQEQQSQQREQQVASQIPANSSDHSRNRQATAHDGPASHTSASGNPAPQYNDPELNRRLEEQRRQTEAREAQIAEMKRKMMQQQRDAEALDRAQDETMAQFEKGNYLEGSRPLAYEFAKQGNAAGAYGTIGVAAGAQVFSWAAEAKRKKEAAEREQREAERIRAEREERERRMREERERLEREAFALLIRQRHTILEAFSQSDPIPLSASNIEADRIYYFAFAIDPQTIDQKRTRIHVSNVFEIAKYRDGTWPYQSRINNEVNALISPHAHVLQGYYFSREEGENMRNAFVSGFRANEGVDITEVEYEGKPSESGSVAGAGSTSPAGHNSGTGLGIPIGDSKKAPEKAQPTQGDNLGVRIRMDH